MSTALPPDDQLPGTIPDRLRAADPDRPDRPDTMAAGRVFVLIVGVLGLAALLNAEAMLHRVETSSLGPGRDLALGFWRPVEAVASKVGFSIPRSGLEAVRDGRLRPDADTGVVAGPSTTRPQLGHAPLRPTPDPAVDEPPLAPTAESPVASPADQAPGPPPLNPLDPLGLPPPPNQPGAEVVPPPADHPGAEAPPTEADPAAPPTDEAAPPAETVPPLAEPPVSEVSPAAPVPPPPAGGDAFPLRRPTVEDPLRVLIIGDSTIDAVGNSVLRDLSATGVASAQLDFRVSTGLSRPDFFDWPTHLRQARTAQGTEVVIVMIGANDAQPFLIDDQPESFGTERWIATYRGRVAALLDELTAAGGWVIWVGQPIMRSGDFDTKMALINQIYAEEASRYPNAIFVDTRGQKSDEAGGYAAYLIDGNGDRQLVRHGDGIHLTAAGGDRVAPFIIDRLNEIAPLY